MSVEEIVKRHGASFTEWWRHVTFEHPVPFVGIPPTTQLSSGWQELYESFSQRRKHKGHPKEGQIETPKPLAFDPCQKRSYRPTHLSSINHGQAVQQVAAQIYSLGIGTAIESGPSYKEMLNCLAIACLSISNASTEIKSVVPVRIGFDYHEPYFKAPIHPAVLIKTATSELLLPVTMYMYGSAEPGLDAEKRKGWSIESKKFSTTHTNTAMSVARKFYSVPNLRIQDVMMLSNAENEQQGWKPRRYADIWGINMNSDAYLFKKSKTAIHEDMNDMTAIFSSIPELTKELLRVSPTFTSRLSGEIQPFQLLRVFEFSLTARHGARLRKSKSSQKCNGRKTCALFADCHLLRVDGARYCVHHIKTIMIVGDKFHYGAGEDNGRLEWRIAQYLKTESARKAARWLCDRISNRTKEVWIVDIEFHRPPHAFNCAALPWEMAICCLHSGRTLLSTNIDYGGMSAQEVWTSLYGARSDNGWITFQSFRSTFTRRYGETKTNGLAPSTIRQRLLGLGFSYATHELISYCSIEDMHAMKRVLDGRDDVHAPLLFRNALPPRIFQPVSIFELAKCMCPRMSLTLKELYTRLFPDSTPLQFHSAAIDAWALREISMKFNDVLLSGGTWWLGGLNIGL
ncbi:uncharacterized protein J3D65DRAFT_602019 [Phyllosticta citribraziliensis]|uniref:Uncharacterized protein n=1 Tax=Phyllosticta citribraziliensis TaxID=989973 RepID=A0ABR1LXY2_9PEZI